MPMPRLFKRLSQKNLRKRSQSTDSANSPRDDEKAPPPPLPKSPTSVSESYRMMTPSSTIRTLSRPSTAPSPQPNGVDGTVPRTGSPSPLRPLTTNLNGTNVKEDGDGLAEAWAAANKAPTASKTDKALRKIEDQVLGVQAIQTNNATLITGATAVLEATGGLQAIERGLNSFMEGSAVLMNALDEVAKLHPFVGVAVMAFKAVWTLEMKRRENDKKIISLHVEMKDMMTVLLQLKGIKDPTEVAPDGTSIKGRLQELAKGTADDIKACANACDTYSKKKLVVKIINGPVWEGRLLKFVGLFTKRRAEYEFALTIHTARGVDAANQTLGDVDKTTQEMNAKMDMMMKMFARFVLPEQKEMTRLIDQKGGPKACQESDKILKELSEFEQKNDPVIGSSAMASVGSHAGRKAGDRTEFAELKEDLHTSPDEAIERNMTIFSRKFEIQKRQITEELSRVIRREGDRVISAVTSGPHDRIIDPDVFKLWKEMGWRGSVKARHFVMALRDYFHEKWNSEPQTNTADGAEPATPISVHDIGKEDEWALAYLNVVRLQPICEAFDDDASGFITVAEVNTFTTSRPIGWSLPQWVAYWAVGWHQTLVFYADKIRDIMGKMFAVLPNVRPENRTAVNEYLLTVYEKVTTLQDSINYCYVNDALQARFKSYVDSEEERLRANLAAVDYDIDAMDTLALVTGPGRIERYILPLLYLLVKRHFEIMRVSQKRITHPDELWDAADTIQWALDGVYQRVNVLESIFTQQKLDVKKQFKSFAHGLFEYWNEPSGLWAPAIVRESDPPDYPYNDELEEKDIKAEDICNYPLDQQGLDLEVYDLPTTDALEQTEVEVPLPLKAVLGTWGGYPYYETKSTSGMISFTLLQEEGQDTHFKASGRSNMTEFKISGQCSFQETEGLIDVSFKRTFPARLPPQYWRGKLDIALDTISGVVCMDEESTTSPYTFVLKRTPPEILRFRPAPKLLEGAKKARALWAFAISVVRAEIRRQSWSWSFFLERRRNRNRFVELYIRNTEFGKPLNQAESAELSNIKQTLSHADSRFYHSLALYKIRITTVHGRSCDNCDGNIGGSRIICLVCQTKDTWNAVDLCDAPECVTARVVRDDLTRAHLPTHDLVKVRRVVHLRQFGQLERASKEALERARVAMGIKSKEDDDDDDDDDDTDEEEDHEEEKDNAKDNVKAGAVDEEVGGQKVITLDMGDNSLNPLSPKVEDGHKCILCQSRVNQPCWYCIQCKDHSFICDSCDSKDFDAFSKYQGPHDYNTHDLVRCRDLVEDLETSVEERLVSLEGQFSNHEKVMDGRLAQLEAKVEDRLSRVEILLERMIGKLGIEASV